MSNSMPAPGWGPQALHFGADILTAEQMRQAEQMLIDAGISVELLMARAGRGAAELIWRMAGPLKIISVLVGPGHNGGDGWVIARHLHERGARVQVVMAHAPASEASRLARAAFEGHVVDCPDHGDLHGDILVDCLYGTGLSRPLSDLDLDLLTGLAAGHRRRVALDLPSGVEADRGDDFGQDLPQYDLTIALGAWKRAHGLMPAAGRMGVLKLVEIGCDPVAGAGHMLEGISIAPPAPGAHKYTRGLLGVVAGAMPGAALMAARAAGGAGAGYVRLLTQDALPAPADLVVQGLDGLADKRLCALLVGPGLGRDKTAEAVLKSVLATGKPLVLDGDALMLLTPAQTRGQQAIVTPHEGEFAALESAFALHANGSKVKRAKALAEASGMVVVAKGPDTVVATPAGRWTMLPRASSWLSVAGSGDVLAGLIASRLATGASTGVSAFEAACQGAWLHGRAAGLLGGPFTAMALAEAVPAAVHACL
ncbi:NAD(P)H-hydrate epimerase [Novosphingobium rosa]|uniref:NAD(P)H-hydrate epimerase n=1 Tax=Novosphingobium rosa TaxID=76978 RepID=UPI000A668EDE|nr:NAD(P)H-hydrate epimerase [Novosphingobium rosa]